MLTRILDTFFRKRVIGNNYLVRWEISRTLRLYLHWFKNSDRDVMHDHPWNFISIILWGGYYEETPYNIEWKPPGSILYRPAEWIHRVILFKYPGNPCHHAWTLVWLGWVRRSWGFHCPEGFKQAKEFFKDDGCNYSGAGKYA